MPVSVQGRAGGDGKFFSSPRHLDGDYGYIYDTIRRANGPRAEHASACPAVCQDNIIRTDDQHAAYHAYLVRMSVDSPFVPPLPWETNRTNGAGDDPSFVECHRVGGGRKTLPTVEFQDASGGGDLWKEMV